MFKNHKVGTYAAEQNFKLAGTFLY